MRLIQGRYYVPNNSAVIITGDVAPAAAFKVARGPVRRLAEAARAIRSRSSPSSSTRRCRRARPRSSPSRCRTSSSASAGRGRRWARTTRRRTRPTSFRSSCASRTRDFSATLVDSGLTAGVQPRLLLPAQRRADQRSCCRPRRTRRARPCSAVYDEIAHFNDPAYFTDEELESAKALLEADDLYSREKLSSVHARARLLVVVGGPRLLPRLPEAAARDVAGRHQPLRHDVHSGQTARRAGAALAGVAEARRA